MRPDPQSPRLRLSRPCLWCWTSQMLFTAVGCFPATARASPLAHMTLVELRVRPPPLQTLAPTSASLLPQPCTHTAGTPASPLASMSATGSSPDGRREGLCGAVAPATVEVAHLLKPWTFQQSATPDMPAQPWLPRRVLRPPPPPARSLSTKELKGQFSMKFLLT